MRIIAACAYHASNDDDVWVTFRDNDPRLEEVIKRGMRPTVERRVGARPIADRADLDHAQRVPNLGNYDLAKLVLPRSAD